MKLIRNGRGVALAPHNLNREFDALTQALFAPAADKGFSPAFEVHETEEAYILEADVPGIPREALEITVEDNRVTVGGERKADTQTAGKTFHRSERKYGRFERSFTVRDGFDTQKVEATVEHGILRLTLPKRAEQKPRRIEVTVN